MEGETEVLVAVAIAASEVASRVDVGVAKAIAEV